MAPLLAEPVRWRRRELSEDDHSSVSRQRNYHHNSNYYTSMFFFTDAVGGRNILANLRFHLFFLAPPLAQPVRAALRTFRSRPQPSHSPTLLSLKLYVSLFFLAGPQITLSLRLCVSIFFPGALAP